MEEASKTTGWKPRRLSWIAAAMPAGPAPITEMFWLLLLIAFMFVPSFFVRSQRKRMLSFF